MKLTYETVLDWIQKNFVFHGDFSTTGEKELCYITNKEDNSYIILTHEFGKRIKFNMADMNGGRNKLHFETCLDSCFDASFIISLIKKVLDSLEIVYKD